MFEITEHVCMINQEFNMLSHRKVSFFARILCICGEFKNKITTIGFGLIRSLVRWLYQFICIIEPEPNSTERKSEDNPNCNFLMDEFI